MILIFTLSIYIDKVYFILLQEQWRLYDELCPKNFWYTYNVPAGNMPSKLYLYNNKLNVVSNSNRKRPSQVSVCTGAITVFPIIN